METKIIMRYKREKAAWICWNCEMENDMSGQECYFCRAKRDNARIVKSWAEEAAIGTYERKPNLAPDTARNYDFIDTKAMAEPVKETKADHKKTRAKKAEKEDSIWGPVLIWAILLIVIVLVIMVASS